MQQEEKDEAAGGAITSAPKSEEATDTGAAAGSYGGPADETEGTYETDNAD